MKRLVYVCWTYVSIVLHTGIHAMTYYVINVAVVYFVQFIHVY